MTSKKDLASLEDLTPKEMAFLEEWLKHGNATEAAMKTYNCKTRRSASVMGARVLAKVDKSMALYMEANGIDVKRLVEVTKDGLQANKVLSAKVIVQGDHKEATTQTDDFIEVPDHLTRHKYLETAAKWLGVEKKESASVEMTDGNRKLVFKVTRGE